MMSIVPFRNTLSDHAVELKRDNTTILQINVGLLCNLACRHCHLEAGPTRTECMQQDTARLIVSFARRNSFSVIDITGGAPELNPNLPFLVSELAGLTAKLIVRTNLTALAISEHADLPLLYRKHKVAIVASLPAINCSQTEAQRGAGVWAASIAMLKSLNEIGYGTEGGDLELDLVSNPTGAFLPGQQNQVERRYRYELQKKNNIRFNNLFTFANVPMGRFRQWLELSGNLDGYFTKLYEKFNICTIPGLMCRSLISVDWDGIVYDCDFNLAGRLPHGGERIHISELTELPLPGTEIQTGEHCYACTAGSGFT